MKFRKFLLLALIAALFSFSLTFLFYAYYIIQDVQELEMKVKIGDVVGLDVNTSIISFGTVSPGGSSQRPVILRNDGNKPLRAHIKKSGEMAEWVYISEEDFVLDKNETKNVIFTIIPSGDAGKGEYRGKARF